MISVHHKVKAVADLLTICKMLINVFRFHTGVQSGTCVTCERLWHTRLTITLTRHAHSHARTLVAFFPTDFRVKERLLAESLDKTPPPPSHQLSADLLLTRLLTPCKTNRKEKQPRAFNGTCSGS